MDLSALAEPEPGRAVSGLTERMLHRLDPGLGAHPVTFADRSSLRSLSGHRLASALTLHRWQTGSTVPHTWSKVASRSIVCMMTARRRAAAH